MAIKLASLFIELAANGDRLTAELRRASGETQGWSSATKKAGVVAGAAFAGAAVAATSLSATLLAVFAGNSGAIAAQEKFARRIGTSSESLEVMRIAARAVGVDFEGVNDTLADFVERLGEARLDGGEPAEALTLLRLSAEDLAAMDPAAAFREVLEAMRQLPDAGQRAATAAKLFGDAGIELTTNADALATAIDGAADKLERMGGGLTALESAQVVEATAAMADLALLSDNAQQKITGALAPAITSVARQLFDTATQGQQLDRVLQGAVNSAIDGLASVSRASASILGFIDGREELATYGVLGYLIYGKKGILIGSTIGLVADSVEAEFNKIRGFFGDASSDVDKLQQRLQILENQLFKEQNAESFLGGIFAGREGEAERIQAEIDGIVARIEDMGSEADRATGFLGDASNALLDLANAIDNRGTAPVISLPALSPVPTQGAPANDSSAGPDTRVEDETAVLQTIEERTMASWGRQSDYYLKLQEQRSAHLIARHDEEVASLAHIDSLRSNYFAERTAQEQHFQDLLTLFMASGTADRIEIVLRETATIFETFGQHNKKLFKIHKTVGIANAIVSTAQGVAEALKIPFPANLAAAAIVAIKGADQIATIRNTEFGSDRAPSVSGGGGAASSTGAQSPAASVPGIGFEAANDANAGNRQTVTFNVTHPAGTSQATRYNDFLSDLEQARRNKDVTIDDNADIRVNYLDATA